MPAEDSNLTNRVQFFFKDGNQYLHECEMNLTNDIAEIILDQIGESFSVELATGRITYTADRVLIQFAASREKLQALQKAFASILMFYDRMN